MRIRNRSQTLFLIRVDPRESAEMNFLNCTKNTELTRRDFARTVSFALTKKQLFQPRKPLEGKSQKDTRVSAPMKSDQWKTYRTRFLVKAKQLNSSLTFTDHLGRQHCGRKGDYLVESCDGVLCITPRQIFEDIYVPMGFDPDPDTTQPEANEIASPKDFRFEPLRLERITASLQDSNSRGITSERFPRARKSPQPVRSTATRLGLM